MMSDNKFDRDDDEKINGYAAECMLDNAIQRSKKIHAYDFDSEVLASAIESDPAGLKHFEIAKPFLSAEFAVISVDERGRKLPVLPTLNVLPAIAVIDYALGLDCCLEVFGYRIGIDVTVNPNSITKKLRKKRELTNVYKKLRFDKIVILVVENTFDSQVLESSIKTVKNSNETEFNHVVYI
jgi:hypothetical protein